MAPDFKSPPVADGVWMGRALSLAHDSIGLAHPNPHVGAIIVKGHQKLGEGFHEYDKRDHAEIVALKQAGEKARGATLYVTLEPCCTTGRTGPCTKAVIEAGIARVVVAMKDPNPAVAGRGVAELEKAGIEVLLKNEANAQRLNEAFAKWIRTRLPFVTLKSALTLDGQIATRPGHSTPITGDAAHAAVQRMRHHADALLTGIGTVLADDPLLMDRSGMRRRRPLLRVVVDSHLRLPPKSKLVKNAKSDLLVFTTQSLDSPRAKGLVKAGLEIFRTRARNRRGHVCLDTLMAELGRREMLHVLLEAGATLNGAALKGDLVDKLALFYAPKIMGTGGVPMADIPAKEWFAKSQSLKNLSVSLHAPDFLVEGYLHDVYGDHRSRRKN
jgi:diaminohydroxyphosphoribosylaminopyrimidine deaminase / 5-amino-6-(5-phosphoribosylamino)uracil reductase